VTGQDLRDQVAVVTGGGAGIGRGVAEALAGRGADVVIADIDLDRAGATAASVEASGRRGLAVETDVMDTDQVRAAVALADHELGRVDILVNNAGGVSARLFLEQSERSWRRHIDINLVSALATTSAAAPLMVRGGRGGSIVNVTSIEASRAAPMYAVYAACKAALVSFTRTMALELSEHGIRVNAIAPDRTLTPGLVGLQNGPVPDELPARTPEEHDSIKAYVPMGREADVADCGEVVAFLCSPAASYITGVLVPVDGGTWASSGWTRTPGGAWSLTGLR
jgi:NAD(P)-dependent dehydrogenase (short-subunit alcohol dehydrogenase family)